jgi:carbon-monoxide dehydrogenase large subunit
MGVVGTPVRRVEDARLLVGGGSFVADLDLPDALVVAYVTSTIAHGRILAVDVSAARELPGVVDVITAADVGGLPLPPMNAAYPEAMVRYPLATDRVRFVGEPIVAIVAEDAATAADAIDLVAVDYDPLPAVVRAEDALTGEVLLFPEAGTNVLASSSGGADLDALDFDACEVVVEAVFVNQRLAPCPIETRVAASAWDDNGRLTHYASCQGAHPIRAQLAQVYALDPTQIRVITRDVGGSFGAKARAYPEELLLPLLARRTGRAVRWLPPRSADMVGLGHSRAQRQHIRIGGDRDGTIRSLAVHVLADSGAYPGSAPALANNTGNLLPGPYRIPQVSWKNDSVLTNTTPIVAYRGAGRPEAAALMERAIDLFAAEAGLDPVAVRRQNLLRADELPYRSPTGLLYDSGDYGKALDAVLAAAGYDELRDEQRARRSRQRGAEPAMGIGLSVFIDRTAGVPGTEYGSVELQAGGMILVRTGSSPYGQGHHTAWAMLVSDRTGLPMDRITVVHGDTDVVPRGGVTGGSRSAQKAGSAIVEATNALVNDARSLAADLLEASVDDVVLDVGLARFHVAGAPGATVITWADLADRLGADASTPALRCEADVAGDGPTFPYGAYLAVVDVDLETGFVTLRRMVTVDDAGTILNPMLALGQVHGGLAQGIAQGMFEEFVYDTDGNPMTTTFADYQLPSAADMPSFECALTETPSPNNPMGFKGIAESGTVGAPPAVQNAIIDALAPLGIHHLDLPVTPESVWRAIHLASS